LNGEQFFPASLWTLHPAMLPGTAPNSVTAAIIEHYPEHLPEFEIALNTRMRKSEQYRTEWLHLNFERAIACQLVLCVSTTQRESFPTICAPC
jgi:hypothetical protein